MLPYCIEPEPPFFALSQSRPNLVGAGVAKKWRFRNTAM